MSGRFYCTQKDKYGSLKVRYFKVKSFEEAAKRNMAESMSKALQEVACMNEKFPQGPTVGGMEAMAKTSHGFNQSAAQHGRLHQLRKKLNARLQQMRLQRVMQEPSCADYPCIDHMLCTLQP